MIKKILARYPYPISGLILGLAALGNLIRGYGEIFRYISGGIAVVLLVLLKIKIVTDKEGFKTFMENPIASAAFATAPMSVTILSTYFPGVLGKGIYFTGIVLNVIMIIWFTLKFAFRFKINEIFTTWSILYVGIVTASVAAPVHKLTELGQAAFWIGFAGYFLFIPLICYRVFVIKNIPEPIMPALLVFPAPISLLLTGYMSAFPEKNIFMIYLLVCISAISYIYALILLPKLLKLKFYPTISAFTFPMVISAIGMKMFTAFIKKTGGNIRILSIVVKAQEIIAVAIVVYVLIKYLQFIIREDN